MDEVTFDLQKFALELEAMTDEEVAQAVLAINKAVVRTSGNNSERRAEERELVNDCVEALAESGQLESSLEQAGLDSAMAERLQQRAKRNKRMKLDWSFINSCQSEGAQADEQVQSTPDQDAVAGEVFDSGI